MNGTNQPSAEERRRLLRYPGGTELLISNRHHWRPDSLSGESHLLEGGLFFFLAFVNLVSKLVFFLYVLKQIFKNI